VNDLSTHVSKHPYGLRRPALLYGQEVRQQIVNDHVQSLLNATRLRRREILKNEKTFSSLINKVAEHKPVSVEKIDKQQELNIRSRILEANIVTS